MRAMTSALAVLLLLLAGCQSGPSGTASRASSDPLYGIGAPAMPAGDRNPPATVRGNGLGSPPRQPGPLAGYPTPTGPTSQAALVSGSTGTLDPAAPLRIADRNPAEARGENWHGAGERPRGNPQPAHTTPPVGTGGGDTTPALVVPPLTQVAHRTSGATLEQLLQSVEQRGAVRTDLGKNARGEHTFRCRVPDRFSPSLLHCYEATAESSTAAVEAVLEQIDNDRR